MAKPPTDPNKKYKVTVTVYGDDPLLDNPTAKNITEVAEGIAEPVNGMIVVTSAANKNGTYGEKSENTHWNIGFQQYKDWQSVLNAFDPNVWTYHLVA